MYSGDVSSLVLDIINLHFREISVYLKPSGEKQSKTKQCFLDSSYLFSSYVREYATVKKIT